MTEAALQALATKRAMVLHLTFSEPPAGFEPPTDLLATNALITEWTRSPDNKTYHVLALAPEHLLAAPSASSASGTGTVQPAVQFVLPRGNYRDAAGNLGAEDLVLVPQLDPRVGGMDPGVQKGMDRASQAAAAAIPAAAVSSSVAAAALGGYPSLRGLACCGNTSTRVGGCMSRTAGWLPFACTIRHHTRRTCPGSLRPFRRPNPLPPLSPLSPPQGSSAKGSLLQGSYHLQLLTMTAYLASRGVGEDYSQHAVNFRCGAWVRMCGCGADAVRSAGTAPLGKQSTSRME